MFIFLYIYEKITYISKKYLTKENNFYTHRIFDRCNFLAKLCETKERMLLRENIVASRDSIALLKYMLLHAASQRYIEEFLLQKACAIYYVRDNTRDIIRTK